MQQRLYTADSVSCECNKFDINKKFEDAKGVIKNLLQYNGQSKRKRSKEQTVTHKVLKIEQQKNNKKKDLAT